MKEEDIAAVRAIALRIVTLVYLQCPLYGLGFYAAIVKQLRVARVSFFQTTSHVVPAGAMQPGPACSSRTSARRPGPGTAGWRS